MSGKIASPRVHSARAVVRSDSASRIEGRRSPSRTRLLGRSDSGARLTAQPVGHERPPRGPRADLSARDRPPRPDTSREALRSPRRDISRQPAAVARATSVTRVPPRGTVPRLVLETAIARSGSMSRLPAERPHAQSARGAPTTSDSPKVNCVGRSKVDVRIRLRPIAGQPAFEEKAGRLVEHRDGVDEDWGFRSVFGPDTQTSDVYDQCGLAQKVRDVLDGCDQTVMCYGQTAAGKTHTLVGDSRGTAGLMQLSLGALFAVSDSKRREGVQVNVQVVVFEVLDSGISDLVASAGEEHEEVAFAVKGKRYTVQKIPVDDIGSAAQVLVRALRCRAIGSSEYNATSSRTHAVVQLIVKTQRHGQITEGVLTLVDLAGSERENNNPTDAGKMEARAINQSLSQLNRMLVKLSFGQLDDSDRRQSCLNCVLHSSFKSGRVTMIFCVHPGRECVAVARNTLQMATRCTAIRVALVRTRYEAADPTCRVEEVEELEDEVAQLEEELRRECVRRERAEAFNADLNRQYLEQVRQVRKLESLVTSLKTRGEDAEIRATQEAQRADAAEARLKQADARIAYLEAQRLSAEIFNEREKENIPTKQAPLPRPMACKVAYH